MIKNKFTSLAMGALALSLAFSTPAMAGSPATSSGLYEKYEAMTIKEATAACPADQIKARKTMKNGVRTIDFTDQPEICLAAYMKTVSTNVQVILAEREEEPWRKVTIDAAKDIQKQIKKPVIVALYKDVNPDDQRAITSFWSGGEKAATYALEDTLGIFDGLLRDRNVKDYMVSRGVAVQGLQTRREEIIKKVKKELNMSSKKNTTPVEAANN